METQNAKMLEHSCFGMGWKSMDYNVKNVSRDFSGNIHRKCPIFFPDLYLTDWMITSLHPDHSTDPTHSTGPGGFHYWIAGKQIWRSRQNIAAAKISTNRHNLTKLFAHFLDTQIQLGNQKSTPSTHGNPLKKCPLSENAMKKDEGVLFQPFHV